VGLEERRRRNGPVFNTYHKAHHAVLASEAWFGDGPSVIGKQFTSAKAKERKDKVIDIFRAARRERRVGDAGVADRLEILAAPLLPAPTLRFAGLQRMPSSVPEGKGGGPTDHDQAVEGHAESQAAGDGEHHPVVDHVHS
jgi:hypothetical protein